MSTRVKPFVEMRSRILLAVFGDETCCDHPPGHTVDTRVERYFGEEKEGRYWFRAWNVGSRVSATIIGTNSDRFLPGGR